MEASSGNEVGGGTMAEPSQAQIEAALSSRPPIFAALKAHILRARKRKREEDEMEEEEERLRLEQERKRKESAITLEEVKEDIRKWEKKLTDLKEEKHELFSQLKKVLHEDEVRRRQQVIKEQESAAAAGAVSTVVFPRIPPSPYSYAVSSSHQPLYLGGAGGTSLVYSTSSLAPSTGGAPLYIKDSHHLLPHMVRSYQRRTPSPPPPQGPYGPAASHKPPSVSATHHFSFPSSSVGLPPKSYAYPPPVISTTYSIPKGSPSPYGSIPQSRGSILSGTPGTKDPQGRRSPGRPPSQGGAPVEHPSIYATRHFQQPPPKPSTLPPHSPAYMRSLVSTGAPTSVSYHTISTSQGGRLPPTVSRYP
ncbi:unnamed protein product [Cyprideis torosa]|uniref:Uncharacterized protein n=1 Tax=Cyprideis torosa TaxID=163714 RepID=A0A7R8WB10_9CRUS|nr:unnamed protein product [Cyprideis torosa]CAG0888987.1 unnamed protein product [Cyprideis torosa]